MQPILLVMSTHPNQAHHKLTNPPFSHAVHNPNIHPRRPQPLHKRPRHKPLLHIQPPRPILQHLPPPTRRNLRTLRRPQAPARRRPIPRRRRPSPRHRRPEEIRPRRVRVNLGRGHAPGVPRGRGGSGEGQPARPGRGGQQGRSYRG